MLKDRRVEFLSMSKECFNRMEEGWKNSEEHIRNYTGGR